MSIVAVAVIVAPSVATAGTAQKYVVTGTVIEAPTHGPRLCFGIETSLPPQCAGGVPLVDWSWTNVRGVERVGGTTWGGSRLGGTYDGKRFHVLEAGPPRATRHDDTDNFFRTRCDPPPGGWVNRDDAKLGIEHAAALADAARSSPDFVVMWPDRDQPIQVTNVAFTGVVEPHRNALEAIWGGPLCVLQYRHGRAELEATQAALTPEFAQDLGLQFIASSIDEPANRVEVSVVVATPTGQARLARRFPSGLIELEGWLRPVR